MSVKMKKFNLKSEFTVYDSQKALPNDVIQLIKAAEEAQKKAYAPYSNFLVGAALRLENGEIISGSNQENAAYPSGLCAERTAIFYASSQFPNQKILQMAVLAGSKTKPTKRPIPPCGDCR